MMTSTHFFQTCQTFHLIAQFTNGLQSQTFQTFQSKQLKLERMILVLPSMSVVFLLTAMTLI